jgi:hypothetical protein
MEHQSFKTGKPGVEPGPPQRSRKEVPSMDLIVKFVLAFKKAWTFTISLSYRKVR